MQNTAIHHWHISPIGLPGVIRQCPKCTGKRTFINTERFRVNANKRYLDIWMIFQCEHCRSTWKKTVHQRINPDKLSAELLEAYTVSDPDLLLSTSYNPMLFGKEDVMDYSKVTYDFSYLPDDSKGTTEDSDYVTIRLTSDYQLMVTVSRGLRTCLAISASVLKKYEEAGDIQLKSGRSIRKQKIGTGVEILCHKDMLTHHFEQ